MSKFKQYSIVVFDDEDGMYAGLFDYKDFMLGSYRFVYMGEIPNMPDHHVFAGYNTGKIYSGFHADDFRLPTDEEL